MNPFIDVHKPEVAAAIEHFQKDLNHIRTGQANAELVDGINIMAYETMTPLKQLATITVPEPKLLLIQPWDKAVLKDIEKGIVQANLGFSPVNDGEYIRIPMPHLTEENRMDLVKIVKEKTEKARISIRLIRDKVKDEVIKAEKEGELTEDDRYKYLKQLDEYTNKQNDIIAKMTKTKEEKIMTI